MDVTSALIALLTLAAGAVAGWCAAIARSATSVNGATAAVAAERDSLRSERDLARSERDIARADLAGTRQQLDLLAVELRDAAVEAAQATSRLASQEETREQLKGTFAALSNQALEQSNRAFLDLADARFKQAGAPLTETLDKVERQMRDIERTRVEAQARLGEQIDVVRRTGEGLKQETASLVSALRKPQVRGRWGELQLRRCVELAGMTNQCDFVEQVSVTTADGVQRPDLIVRLVGGKSIVVDSKVTLAAYLEAFDAVDDSVREERLDAHARHLREHVNQLAAKAYAVQFSPSPEFVVLFVPGDAFLATALDRDPMLLEDAFKKGIHISSPTTLISVLRTCAYAWQQEALAENAREVFDLGKELYKRLSTLGGHFDKLGRSLSSSVKTYNDAVGSMERQVLVTARKLNDLEVVGETLVASEGVIESVRVLTAPELLDSAESSRPVVALPQAASVALPPAVASAATDEIDQSYGVG